MMATTRADIARWFGEGVRDKMVYMIVVCDTFDHEDYPVYAMTDTQVLEQFDQHNGQNMQRVMEVYDLRLDKDSQLAKSRAWHLPKRAVSDD